MWQTYLVAGILAVILALIVWSIIRNKKKGKGCGCGCAGCTFKDSCHNKEP